MDFLIGFLGAMVAMTIFGLGAVVGWVLRGKDADRARNVTAEKLSEKQRQQLIEEQEAWKALHNYSVDDAYGTTSSGTTTHNKE